MGQLSWNDAVKFCEWLSRKEGKTYRLPTEAEWEWEWACRAGRLAAYHFGDDSLALNDYAWGADNSGDRSHPVGSKKPNAWGLFDVHGNVAEYCHDWYGPYPIGRATDPQGPATGTTRVVRSYGFFDPGHSMTANNRAISTPTSSMNHFGFRIVCDDVSGPPLAVAPLPRPKP